MRPVTPVRILDSRPNKITNGQPGAGAFGADEFRSVVVLGRGAVPLSGVAGIIGNLTVIPASAGGYLTVWPAGYQRPTASNLNFAASGPVGANAFACALNSDGAISVVNAAGAGTHIIIDVQGWIPADELLPHGPFEAFTAAPAPLPVDSAKATLALANAVGYAMNVWWPGAAQTLLAADLGWAGAKAGNHDAVRRLAMMALGLSTGLAAGLPGAPAMLSRTIALVDRVAGSHISNSAGGWGEDWQTPMWAAICGRAAWFNWGAMPSATRAAVAKMVAAEADYAARHQLHYLRDAAGNVLTAGDTGAEEVSWWGLAMQVGLVMLPTHANAGIWGREVERYALAAAAKPQDVAALAPLITGSNVEANGEVINHGRRAPDYAACLLYQNMDAAALFALAGRATPAAMRQLSGAVYAALVALYVPGTAAVTYPAPPVADWGTAQMAPYALADLQALVYGYDTTGMAAQYLTLHLDAQLAMQARFPDGHTYAAGEYPYEGNEEHVTQLLAQLWTAMNLRDRGLGSFA